MECKRERLVRLVMIMVHFFGCATSDVTKNITLPGYQTTKSRDDLFCPETCLERDVDYNYCCACNALPCWKINASACGVEVQELYIEYIDPFGGAVLVDVHKTNTSLFIVNHANGRLKKVPENACNFANSLVEIDMRNNYIGDISGFGCLRLLDTLKLDHNKITEIPDGIFSQMEHLRYLSLAHNHLVDLQAFAIKIKQGNIFNVDFSYNSFRNVDVTNILRPGEFCEIKFVGSEIENQTNTENYTVQKGVFHGPGKLNCASSKGQIWLNFSSLGVDHYSEFGSYMDLILDWDNTSIHCDCNIVPFLRDLGTSAHKYWPNIENEFGISFICETPEKMKGVNLTQLYNDANYDDLVCSLEVCPSACSCTDKQSQNKVTVKCQGLDAFPDFMPVGFWGNNKIELELGENSISELPSRDYLSRVTSLNLTGTAISQLDPDAINQLKAAKIFLPHQEVLRLPETFYNLNPANVIFGSNVVLCDCSNLWISDWITQKHAPYALTCSTDKGFIDALSVTAEFLNCPKPETQLLWVIWFLVGVAVTVIAVAIFVYNFRYELMLLRRRLTFKPNKQMLEQNEYDVFLSFSVDNDEIRRWVRESLLDFLSKNKYSCFVPYRDIVFGDDWHVATAAAIINSRNLIIVLSEDYMEDNFSTHEFDTIWKSFSGDTNKQIIVINYNPLRASEIRNRRLKAVIRIRYDLNFKDRESEFRDRLHRRLGRARRQTRRHEVRHCWSFDNLNTEDTLPPPEIIYQKQDRPNLNSYALFPENSNAPKNTRLRKGTQQITVCATIESTI